VGTAGHIVHDCVPAGKESKRGDRGGVPGSSAGGRRGPVVPGIFPGGTSVVSTAATHVCLARTDRAPGCRIRRGEGESAEGKALASGRRWAPLPLRLWACIFHGADRRCASVEWWEMLCYASFFRISTKTPTQHARTFKSYEYTYVNPT